MQQFSFFDEPQVLSLPKNLHGLEEQLRTSREIVQMAINHYNPYAIVLMLSGGDDSITALLVAKMLGVKINYVMHGDTGTGLPAVKKYVTDFCAQEGYNLLIADAGNAFEDYVTRKGFFGVGVSAHQFSYHLLKWNPFNSTISRHIRKGKADRKILLLNGVRVEESSNRMDNFSDNVVRLNGNNIWVNIIHWFSKKECLSLLESENIKRSPVAIALGRSGECNCGTMQNEASRIACAQFDPKWGEWMSRIRKFAIEKHGFDISQNPSKKILKDRLQEIIPTDFMPMCVGCKAQNMNQTKLF